MIPQLIYLGLTVFGLGIAVAKNGQPTTHNAGHSVVAMIIVLSLQYWGGFYDPFFR